MHVRCAAVREYGTGESAVDGNYTEGDTSLRAAFTGQQRLRERAFQDTMAGVAYVSGPEPAAVR